MQRSSSCGLARLGPSTSGSLWQEIGFGGCLVSLWRELDPDGGGHISLHDIDSAAALQLSEFKAPRAGPSGCFGRRTQSGTRHSRGRHGKCQVLLLKQFQGSVENFMKNVPALKAVLHLPRLGAPRPKPSV